MLGWVLREMAESLSRSVQALQETLRSKSPNRGSHAATIAEDLYTLTIERITDTELGKLEHSPSRCARVSPSFFPQHTAHQCYLAPRAGF